MYIVDVDGFAFPPGAQKEQEGGGGKPEEPNAVADHDVEVVGLFGLGPNLVLNERRAWKRAEDEKSSVRAQKSELWRIFCYCQSSDRPLRKEFCTLA